MSPNLADFSIILEQQADGTAVASVLEMPYWRVEAATKEQALTDVRQMLNDRLQHIEIIPAAVQTEPSEVEVDRVEASKRPWREFADMFKDDPHFAQIVEAIQAERNSDDESEVDPSVYGGKPVKS
jgi:predicted RNase H-like HicB family nuclease